MAPPAYSYGLANCPNTLEPRPYKTSRLGRTKCPADSRRRRRHRNAVEAALQPVDLIEQGLLLLLHPPKQVSNGGVLDLQGLDFALQVNGLCRSGAHRGRGLPPLAFRTRLRGLREHRDDNTATELKKLRHGSSCLQRVGLCSSASM